MARGISEWSPQPDLIEVRIQRLGDQADAVVERRQADVSADAGEYSDLYKRVRGRFPVAA